MNLIRLLICALVAALGPCVSLAADTPAPETQAAYTPPSAQPFGHEELDQLVAPIALYSDALLAQVLMASTYPLEVVEAERWVKENSSLKGEALLSALDKERWDPSVKSLAQVPQVLHMMSDKLDWTQKLGDAFLAQQKDVMDAVQRLRHMADKAGNLKSDQHQKVVHRGASSPPAYAPPPASGSGGTSVVEQVAPSGGDTIIIEQPSPEVIYMPDYNPQVAYGAWPYPSYPPYYWGANYWGSYGYPYAPLGGALAWGVGWGVNAAIWNNAFDWHGGNVYNNYYNSWGANRWNNHHGNWGHNVDHRRGVNYRDQATRDRFSRGDRNVAGREQFRGREGGRGRDGFGGRDGARGQTPRLSDRDMNRRNDRGNRAADRGRQGARGQTPKLSNRDMNRGNRGASDRGRAQNRARNHNREQAQRGNRGGYDRGRAGNRQQAQRGRGGYNRSAQQRMGGNRGNYGRGGYSSPRQANRQSFGGNRYGGGYGGGRGYSGGRGGFDGVGRGGASRSFSSRGGGSRGGMRGGGGRRGR